MLLQLILLFLVFQACEDYFKGSTLTFTHLFAAFDRPEPLQTEVRIAFAESIRVIWIVLIPFVSKFTSVLVQNVHVLNVASTGCHWSFDCRLDEGLSPR